MADNVLWIVTDDQMRSTLRSMNRTWKRLVRKGVHFRQGYSAMPLCGPARASILTSRYPHNHGCDTNMTHQPFVARGLDQDTAATRMKAAGYSTGYFGKYMNGIAQDPTYVAPGWDRWVTLLDGMIDDPRVNVDGTVRRVASQRKFDAFAARRLRRFIRRNEDTGPWFAVFSPTAPHGPYTPSPEHADDFDGEPWDPPAFNEADMSDKPAKLRDLPKQDRRRMRKIHEGKLEELQDVDDQVEKVLDVLRRTRQLRRTWIFFVSDNGFLLGEHRLFSKSQPYEEAAGVPFVVRGPGVAPRTVDALVSQVDLMPTTLDIAGLDPDAGRELDGRSMLGPLRSGEWSSWRRRLIIENTHLDWSLLREGSHAYIEHQRTGEFELYDLERDPHQLTSLGDADVSDWARKTSELTQTQGRALRRFEQ
ncbi:arylsulfatase A-like enzyme [Nocardioides sp. BE266]|uniref:sulfatase-like hydrolase/transferase n=1 Tax=Nocardioides sp. BE266 TaxID=2817725 RepID=UPI00285A0D70|nr:sulfatase-like hydrolase/transferase [Nocardioides sp. BE266]MDR7251241.1 arylsulfatase A-like enzyme [Nocardioides sp. BE266]